MSSILAWLAVWSLAASWLFLVHIFVPPSDGGWAFVAAGLALLVLAARRVRWNRIDPWFYLLAVPAGLASFTWPFPHKIGPLLLLAGLLSMLVLRQMRWLTPLCLGLWTAGAALVAQSGAVVTYFWLGARFHEARLLTPPFYALSRLLGWTVGSSQGSLFLPNIEGMVQATTTWERLGALPAMLLAAGGLALLPMVRRRTSRLLLCLAATCVLASGYLLFRYLVLTAAVGISRNPTVFWLPVPVALTFLPLSLMLAKALPLHHVPLGPAPVARHHATGRYLSLALLAFLAGTSFLAWFTFPDPGRIKAGRVLLDEYNSNWEWTTQALDTEWYGQRSGYNYYSLGQWLGYYYQVDTNFQPRTQQLLAQYDVLIIKTPTAPFAPEEVAAIEAWVRAGGGLFLIGDHTNVFGTSSYLNPLARRFDLRFRYDSTYDLPTLRVTQFERPRLLAHPAVLEIPPFLFATSCTLEAPLGADSVMVGYGLRALPVDYSKRAFFPDKEKEQDYPFGLFLQSAAVRHGRGRVVAFTDSTVFSNFTMFLAGKPEYFLGVMNWLNHAERWPWLDSLLAAAALLAGGGALHLARTLDRQRSAIVVLSALLLAAAMVPWVSLQIAKGCYPLPEPHTPPTSVAFEAEHSRILLPTSTAAGPTEASFQTFYVWTQRLGYVPTFAPTLEEALEKANLLVLVDPYRPFRAAEITAVERFVSEGGRLLVLADPTRGDGLAGPAADILAPFGLGLEPRRSTSGAVHNTEGDIQGRLLVGGTVVGGDPLLFLGGTAPIAALARHGQGHVVATAFARPFSDQDMGTTAVVPDNYQRFLFEMEFWLLQGLSAGEFPPLRIPAREGP